MIGSCFRRGSRASRGFLRRVGLGGARVAAGDHRRSQRPAALLGGAALPRGRRATPGGGTGRRQGRHRRAYVDRLPDAAAGVDGTGSIVVGGPAGAGGGRVADRSRAFRPERPELAHLRRLPGLAGESGLSACGGRLRPAIGAGSGGCRGRFRDGLRAVVDELEGNRNRRRLRFQVGHGLSRVTEPRRR